MMKRILPFLLLLCLLLSACGAGERDGVVIALLDTGVAAVAIDSEALLPGWNYVTGSADTEDRLNHGTAVASILLGCESAGVTAMAPGVQVVPLVVRDRQERGGSADPATLAQAIRDSVDNYGADIINLSLGIKTDDPALREAVAYAEEKGVLLVSAVGNEGESADLYYPAAYATVLGVGSHDAEGRQSTFSQRNGTADILAPGEDIPLASLSGRAYTARGTSYATGYVTAAAANLLLQDPTLSPAQLRAALCGGQDPAQGD